MRRRFSLGRSLAFAILLAAPLAACKDEPPSITGPDTFPGQPTTFQMVVPADSFVQGLGSFLGVTGTHDVPYLLVANQFDGALNAHALAKLADFPTSLSYTQGGTTRTDSVFTYGRGTLVARLDTLYSTSSGPIELQVWAAGQDWDPASTTWDLAVDTTGVRTPWREAGGTRAVLLSRVSINNAGSGIDSLLIPIDSLAVQRLASKQYPGFIVTAAGAQGRMQLTGGITLRTSAHPKSASPDTAVALTIAAGAQTFVHTPDQPRSTTGAWEVGGLRSARTLFRVSFPRTVPVCQGKVCSSVPLRDVTLNEVSILLSPQAVPNGFRAVGALPTALRRVVEPELGPRAPLGDVVNEVIGISPSRVPIYGGATYTPGDSLLAIPLTAIAAHLAATDTTSTTLALLSDQSVVPSTLTPPNFGVVWFTARPRLRIVYTVSDRPTLP